MKPTISNLTDALAYQLNELYDAEQKLKQAVKTCSQHVSSPALKSELIKYGDSCGDKRIKLERVFNYLMKEPAKSTSKTMDTLIGHTREMLTSSISGAMKDVLLIACLHTINHFKMAGYGTSLTFARELELETATDLLEQVLTWEKETDKRLSKIALHDVNVKAPEFKI